MGRLGKISKQVVFDNIHLLNHCHQIGVDPAKLHQCNIERMGDRFVFVLSKEGSEELAKKFLEYDLATQPDIVLIMSYNEDGSITFEETSHTVRILNIE